MNTLFIEYNYCAESWLNQNKKCTLTLLDGEKIGLPDHCSKYTKTNNCSDSSKLNLTVNDYNLMMGLTSNFLGFTLVFLVGFLFILQGRR